MTDPLRAALALSIGIHASVFVGWPLTTTVAFDVERAPTSLEIHLVAPRATPVSHTVLPLPPLNEQLVSSQEEPQEPDPIAETVVVPESHGALGDVLPAYLRNPAPAYPFLSRQLGEAGTVRLRVEVLPTGRCGRLTVTSSGFARLDAAASAAVRQWQFKPAQRGGQAVVVWVDIPVRFQLIDTGGD